MVGGVERELGDGARRIDALLDGERRAACIGLAHQPGVAGMRRGIQRQPVERIATAREGGEIRVGEIGQKLARRSLRRGNARVTRLDREPTGNDIERAVIDLAQ